MTHRRNFGLSSQGHKLAEASPEARSLLSSDIREFAAWIFLGAFLGAIAFVFWLLHLGLAELV
jgi:hypothetical protein